MLVLSQVQTNIMCLSILNKHCSCVGELFSSLYTEIGNDCNIISTSSFHCVTMDFNNNPDHESRLWMVLYIRERELKNFNEAIVIRNCSYLIKQLKFTYFIVIIVQVHVKLLFSTHQYTIFPEKILFPPNWDFLNNSWPQNTPNLSLW